MTTNADADELTDDELPTADEIDAYRDEVTEDMIRRAAAIPSGQRGREGVDEA